MLKACSMSKSIDRQAVKILKEKGISVDVWKGEKYIPKLRGRDDGATHPSQKAAYGNPYRPPTWEANLYVPTHSPRRPILRSPYRGVQSLHQ